MLVVDMGVHLWLAIIGSALVGLFVDISGAEGVNPRMIPVYRALIATAGLVCIGLILIKVFLDWGIVAFAAISVLIMGLVAVLVGAAINRRMIGGCWSFFTSAMGGMVALGTAVLIISCVVFPAVGTLETVEYSYGVETRKLDFIRNDQISYLVECHDGEIYAFIPEHKIGDIIGAPKRHSLGPERVVILDENSSEMSHVDGEVTALAKLDPLSGRPIELETGKNFQPTMLYARSSDIWENGTARERGVK